MSAPLQILLPDDLRILIERGIPSSSNLPRWAYEAVVIEAYRESLISRGKVSDLLGLSFHERERFLADRHIPYDYSSDELEADRDTASRVFGV